MYYNMAVSSSKLVPMKQLKLGALTPDCESMKQLLTHI